VDYVLGVEILVVWLVLAVNSEFRIILPDSGNGLPQQKN
jgi:hypothetical protein